MCQHSRRGVWVILYYHIPRITPEHLPSIGRSQIHPSSYPKKSQSKKIKKIFVVWLCNEVSGHFQKKICLKLTKQHGTVHYSAPVRQCVTSIYRPAYKYLPYYTDPPIVPPLKSDTPRIARQHVEPSQYLASPTSIANTTPGILCCAQLNQKATVPLHYEN